MKISADLSPTRSEVEAITSSLRRFERMRSVPGLVLIGALALIAVAVLPAAVAVVAVAGFALMGALTVSWLWTARRASRSALAFAAAEPIGGAAEVVVSASGIVVGRGGDPRELKWPDVLHATRTKAGWIFVARRTGIAVAVPNRLLTDAQVGRLTGLLSAWPARRYRRSPL